MFVVLMIMTMIQTDARAGIEKVLDAWHLAGAKADETA